MSSTNQIQLQFEGSSLVYDLAKGAAISHLTLGADQKISVISPQRTYHFESSLLFPFPNRLAGGKYIFEGNTYAFECNDFGLPNALHGFVHNREFVLTDQGKDTSGTWATSEFKYDGKEECFPFPFLLSVTYKLCAQSLDIQIKVTNTGSGRLPFGLGWHPYFNLPKGAAHSALQLPASKEIKVDTNLIPTGKKLPSHCFDSFRSLEGVALDTCFEVKESGKNTTRIQYNTDHALEIWQDQGYPFIQVFTPEDGQTIAVEPMSCGIDALNNGDGLRVLKPNEDMIFRCGVHLS